MRTTAPGRIDLAGGTLDVPPLCFLIENALTLNLAISLQAEISLEPAEDWQLTTAAGPLDEGEPLPLLFQKTIDYLEVEQPYDIVVTSSIPRASGLGGSSSLLVALVQAFLQSGSAHPAADDLLDLVTVLEHQILGKPAGTQDAIAAIYGGISLIDYRSGRPRREALNIPAFLDETLFLAYSPVQHHSGLNNWGIIKAACEGDQATLEKLQLLADNAHAMLDALKAASKSAFFECLRQEAKVRRTLAEGLMTADMKAFARKLPPESVAKICGAGGGGCMLLFGQLPDPATLKTLAKSQGLKIFEVVLADHGVRSFAR